MKQKSYSIKEYLKEQEIKDLKTFLLNYNKKFEERFGLSFNQEIEVKLEFSSFMDANDFYQEVRYNPAYHEFQVRTTDKDNELIVSGAPTLFDYFGTVEPNLLTVSRDLDIRFEIIFVQSYSATVFTGTVIGGELLSRQCIVQVSDVLPELSLAGLGQIAESVKDFDLLLTRIYTIKGVNLL